MNLLLSVHTTTEQCLYQFLRDGQCYNGQNPFTCEEFKRRADGIDLEGITTDLKARLNDSIVLKYREQGERKKASAAPIPGDEGEPTLRVIAIGGGRANKKAPKSLCAKCGQWVQFPHDPEKVTVTCWLCVANEVLASENIKPETPDTKPKGGKPNGKRTSIPKRKKAGRRNSRA